VIESEGGGGLFFSGSLLTVAVVVVVVFCGASCAPAGKAPIIRADTAKLHFTQFFMRAKPSLRVFTNHANLWRLDFMREKGVPAS
jgi:hypothetical protein